MKKRNAITNPDENGVEERSFYPDIAALPDSLKEFVFPYKFTAPFLQGKDVLDTGCGMGSTTSFMARYAALMIGIDQSQIAIDYARSHYPSDQLFFYVMDVRNLRYTDNKFDVVTSFELLEHLSLPDQSRYLSEISRVLKDDGTVYLSTPNKKGFRQNSYHLHEHDATSLKNILNLFFTDVEIIQESPQMCICTKS